MTHNRVQRHTRTFSAHRILLLCHCVLYSVFCCKLWRLCT